MSKIPTPVEFSLVRYSYVDDVHYFHDPAYPATIQFARNGNWESWGMRRVLNEMCDPEITRLAIDALGRTPFNGSPIHRPRTLSRKHVVVGVKQHDAPHKSRESPATRARALEYPSDSPLVDSSSSSQFYLHGLSQSQQTLNSRLNKRLPASSQLHSHDLSQFEPTPSSHWNERIKSAWSPPSSFLPRFQAVNLAPLKIDSNSLASAMPTSQSTTVLPSARGLIFTSKHGNDDNKHRRSSSSSVEESPRKRPRYEATSPVSQGLPSLIQPPSPASPQGFRELSPTLQPSASRNIHRALSSTSQIFLDPTSSYKAPAQASQFSYRRYSDTHKARPDPPAYPTPPQPNYAALPASQDPSGPSPVSSLSVTAQISPRRPYPIPIKRILPLQNRDDKILLSLDGDGVRGLSQVLIVESLVIAVCSKLDQHVDPCQIFDLIGGASMGGLFGLMIGRLRMQATSAREAYKVIAKEVFANKREFFTPAHPSPTQNSCSGQAVNSAIKKIVTREIGNPNELLLDVREDSSPVFALSTITEVDMRKAAIMRSYHSRRVSGPEVGSGISVWQAMRGACIAPRYASGAGRRSFEPGLVDHGGQKNSPVFDVLYECRKVYRHTNRAIIISIGSGQGCRISRELPEMVTRVNNRAFDAQCSNTKFENDHKAEIETGWLTYFRFEVPGMHDVPLEEWCQEEQIKAKTAAYLRIPAVYAKFYACVDAIVATLLGPQSQRV